MKNTMFKSNSFDCNLVKNSTVQKDDIYYPKKQTLRLTR